MPSHLVNGELSEAASDPLEAQAPSEEETLRGNPGPGTVTTSVSPPTASPPLINSSSSGIVGGAATNVRALQDESDVHSTSSPASASNIHDTIPSPILHGTPPHASVAGTAARSPGSTHFDVFTRRLVLAVIEQQNTQLSQEIAAEKKRFRRRKHTLEQDEKRSDRRRRS